MLLAAAVLLLVEPDFGAAVVLCVTGTAVLFVAGARFRDFLVVCAVGLLAVAALALASPYRLARITAFLNPWEDPFKTGFQLTQSLIAIGRGEWFGVGLGSSIQKLYYLPEAHTDFVFAVFAEEFGLLGVTLIVAAFLALVLRGLRLSRIAADAGDAAACLHCRRLRCLDRPAGLPEHRREHGAPADQGVDTPITLVRPLEHARDACLGRDAASCPSRSRRLRQERDSIGRALAVNRTVMIMAGGTGGHVFPALAIAGQLRAHRDIVWLGTERGIEARLVPAAGYPVEWIEVEACAARASRAGWRRRCASGAR